MGPGRGSIEATGDPATVLAVADTEIIDVHVVAEVGPASVESASADEMVKPSHHMRLLSVWSSVESVEVGDDTGSTVSEASPVQVTVNS